MKKVALITGGSRGIGFGIATHLSDAGYSLAINGVRDESQVDLSSLKDAIYVRGNISSSSDRSSIMSKVRQHFGQLNLLVNNAGMAPRERRDILEATEESFDEVMSTNLKGPYFLTQLVARHMRDAKIEGRVAFITSVSAYTASVNRGEYSVS